MTERMPADDYEYELQLFKRRISAILADHESPASPEHVREIVLAWAEGGSKRMVIAKLLVGPWGNGNGDHPWIEQNREMIGAWSKLTHSS